MADMEGYPPMYAMPGFYEEMAYVDIRGAYYTLYTYLWGVEYWPMRYISLPKVLLAWPEEFSRNKRARNALYGIIRSRGKWAVGRGGKSFWVPNRLMYPQLALAVVDVLHAVMWRAVHDWGAVYVMVDGAILPQRSVPEYMDYLQSMGLRGEVRAVGPARVEGVGAYSIGGIASRRRGNGHPLYLVKDEPLVRFIESFFPRLIRARIEVYGDSGILADKAENVGHEEKRPT
jgi:hypothetical protein